MTEIITHPLAVNGKDPRNLRGDPITQERYYSRDWMEREWDHLWTRIWHIAGRENELPEPGDYIVHDFMHESVIIARQPDGSLKGFYNACGHRAQKLVRGNGSQDSWTCAYHGWVWGLDGSLLDACDRDDFPQGDPVGKVRLIEVRVDTWGGFVWYTMDNEAPPLLKYLEPIPDIHRNFPLEKLVRILRVRVELNCNWKFSTDNFNESYHTRTAHPQVPPIIDQDHFTSRYEMFPNGHARIIQMGRPSLRDRLPEGVPHPFDDQLRAWDIDPARYATFEEKVMRGWHDLKEAKRKLGPERGYGHFAQLTDEEMTESPFGVVFPNIAFGANAEGMGFFRWEPHPDDPEKCFFDLWEFAYPAKNSYRGRLTQTTLEMKEAELDFRVYTGPEAVADLSDRVVFQDWGLSPGQQAGWRSRGYQEPYLAAQETRVRRFHEVLHDYLAGKPPGR
ncbi:aromatic ring-hydroxylating dioxygenase subunit alpha [Iodidimonas sp. SYSU 1G8]|uniref:aromatic ring-hydroxylating oxygenase subunit alpha n=1 Tax=Iodidimonas sp. SYSU 1G8 TaxID=3133967 RepID=UPI0031FEC60E